MTATQQQNADDFRLFEKIAQNNGIETLETRKMDSLDFHEVSVWQLRAMIEQAYNAGRASK